MISTNLVEHIISYYYGIINWYETVWTYSSGISLPHLQHTWMLMQFIGNLIHFLLELDDKQDLIQKASASA